jgi:electron transfer flavoprotein beta subunit
VSEKVIACYKWVRDETDIRFDDDLRPDFSKAGYKISDYDRNAIEAAVQAAKQMEYAIPAGVTAGPAQAVSSMRDALSRGLEEAFHVNTGDVQYTDYRLTADALAKGIEAAGGAVLAICAEGSSDLYGQQTASRLGVTLGWPIITAVVAFEIRGRSLRATRKLENCLETVEAELPAVIAVTPEINTPELPGMRAIIAAKRKPQRDIPLADLSISTEPSVKVEGIKGYQSDRKRIIFEHPEASENVRLFAAALKKEGVM